LFLRIYTDHQERNMRERLLITTAIGLMLGTGAFAQSPNDPPKTNPPPAAQSQTIPTSSAPAASSSTTSTPSSAPAAQNAQSTTSGTPKPATTTSQSAPNTTNQGSPPSQAQSGNNAATAPSQAQSAQPSNSPAQAQTNTAPAANNQSQASPTGTNPNTNNASTQPSTNTAAQPSNSQTNTAQSSSTNVSVSASLNEPQRTRVVESISRLNVAPINNVNFSLSVGTVVPRDVRFQPLPADVVVVLPQYRGYNFFVVRDDIVIVEPSTYKIVDVLPRTGRSTDAAPAPAAPASHKTTFTDRDREVIRKHARSSRIEQRTTGSATSTRVRIGERLPDSVEIRSFPDEIYWESPRLREYRYIERDNRTYVVEPRERTIIEEIE
jgi:Protein of unknown function (DUF1236)